ncbi:hypothetical protein DPMN_025519 [Dreissena polymorpha]|uniref:Uncharacterized protein n=1 Tax=Dreissena polymorpha TaxID=45954 RepID=A0A9D4LPF9_DREPO|nr:hypothetical protein DPMN_025519 [Dreissena polymorpha]
MEEQVDRNSEDTDPLNWLPLRIVKRHAVVHRHDKPVSEDTSQLEAFDKAWRDASVKYPDSKSQAHKIPKGLNCTNCRSVVETLIYNSITVSSKAEIDSQIYWKQQQPINYLASTNASELCSNMMKLRFHLVPSTQYTSEEVDQTSELIVDEYRSGDRGGEEKKQLTLFIRPVVSFPLNSKCSGNIFHNADMCDRQTDSQTDLQAHRAQTISPLR